MSFQMTGATEPIGCSILTIRRYLTIDADARVRFLEACEQLAAELPEQGLVRLWLYSPVIENDREVACLISFAELPAFSNFIASSQWRGFLEAIEPLCSGRPTVTTLDGAQGIVASRR